MSDELQTYIEPEMEARLVALVLGEASAFEAEELERLMAKRSELKVCKERLEEIHGVLVAAHDESDDEKWKLSEERRGKVLERVEATRREKSRQERRELARKRAERQGRRKLVMLCAACVVFGMTLMVFQSLDTSKGEAPMVAYSVKEESVVYDERASFAAPQYARVAQEMPSNEARLEKKGLADHQGLKPKDGRRGQSGEVLSLYGVAAEFSGSGNQAGNPFESRNSGEEKKISDALAELEESLPTSGEMPKGKGGRVLNKDRVTRTQIERKPSAPSIVMKKVAPAATPAPKPTAPSDSMSSVVASNSVTPDAIPVPEMEVPEPMADLGDGDDFGDGWGDGGGGGMGGGGKGSTKRYAGLTDNQKRQSKTRNAPTVTSRPAPAPAKAPLVLDKLAEQMERKPGAIVEKQSDTGRPFNGGFAGKALEKLEQPMEESEAAKSEVAGRTRKSNSGLKEKRGRERFEELARETESLAEFTNERDGGLKENMAKLLPVEGKDEADRPAADPFAADEDFEKEIARNNLDFVPPVSPAKVPGIPAPQGAMIDGNTESKDRVVSREVIDGIVELRRDLQEERQSLRMKIDPLADDERDADFGGGEVQIFPAPAGTTTLIIPSDKPNSNLGINGVITGGVRSRQPVSKPQQGQSAAEAKDLGGGGGPAGSLEQQEIVRRQQYANESDAIRDKGTEAYRNGDFDTSTKMYREALESLPPGTTTKDRREYLENVLRDSLIAESVTMRRSGRYDEARELLKEVEKNDPGNPYVKKNLEYLDDPIRTSPSLTYEHTKNIDKVRRNLYKGEGYYDLGLYDKAEEEFKQVLRVDPYNKAARRWLERAAAIKSSYYRAAYDQTRAQMLAEVDKAWEVALPPGDSDEDGAMDQSEFLFGTEVDQESDEKLRSLAAEDKDVEVGIVDDGLAVGHKDLVDGVAGSHLNVAAAKLKQIVIPEVNFKNTTLEEALAFIELRTKQLDSTTLDPGVRGIQFDVKKPDSETDDELGQFSFDANSGTIVPELKLKNVPVETALGYIADATKTRYQVGEDGKVTFQPLGASDAADLVQPISASIASPLDQIVLPKFQLRNATVGEALDFIRNQSRELDNTTLDESKKGVNLVVDDAQVLDQKLPPISLSRITLRGALQAVGDATGNSVVVDDFAVRLGKERKDDLILSTPSLESASITTKLKQIILPEINLKDTTVSDALEFIRIRAEDLDLNLLDVGKRGFDVSRDDLVDPEATIAELKLKNVPLEVAIREIARQAGLKVRVDEQGVVFFNDPTVKKTRKETGFETSTAVKSDSTFSLNVSDVSFKLAKAALAAGKRPEAEKVRPEEFVNAMNYGDTRPSQTEKISCEFEQGAHPFLSQRNLMRISMSTASLGRNAGTPLRLTLLLDQSGSMERADRVESLKRAFALLAAQLTANDEVTLIGFARTPRLLAERVKGNEVAKLAAILANPLSEGGTNLEEALSSGIQLAKQQFVKGAQNRIILLTDGAANLGDAKPESLAMQVESMRKAGISFDACGVGADGLNDDVLSSLARKGDGRYYFLDRPEDADEGFARQIAGALRPAAKNVKVQVIFNPERVTSFKLYGFEKHKLKKEDFRNDKVDAAEMAAEESGVALYHFEPNPEGRGDVGTVSVRFLDTSTNQMVERTWVIPYEQQVSFFNEADPKLRLAGVAGLFAERLKGSPVGERVELKRLRQELPALKAKFGSQTRFGELEMMLRQAGE